MTELASLPTRMDDPLSAPDARQRYEWLFERAMSHARRLVHGDQAAEVAHEVAVDMLARPVEEISGRLLYIAVVYRLRSLWRSADRRSATERAYIDLRSGGTPAWAQPDSGLLAEELRECIEDTLARMPAGMREAFLLVRDDELSYRDAATRLGVAVGTVHTQVSRANALLRECVRQYHADRPSASRARRGSKP
jgi:RNA polymerase sigma factor (sigma-70 family)